VSLLDRARRRFARPPEAVRAAVGASPHPDERVLAWGLLVRGEGWLAATSVGLRTVPADVTTDGQTTDGQTTEGLLLRWHEIGAARWQATADGGGSFTVTPLAEVEPGVQSRLPTRRLVLADRGDLPAVVRRRVDQTVASSRRSPLPNGGSVLLVARRVPGQAAREWTVVFDDDETRNDPTAREAAREKLEEALAAERPD
jgi:hypothetical protein